MNEILQYLRANGERFDAEIAEAVGLPLHNAHVHLAQLLAKGQIVACQSTRFQDGQQVVGIRCRISGYTPPGAVGMKMKASEIC